MEAASPDAGPASTDPALPDNPQPATTHLVATPGVAAARPRSARIAARASGRAAHADVAEAVPGAGSRSSCRQAPVQRRAKASGPTAGTHRSRIADLDADLDADSDADLPAAPAAALTEDAAGGGNSGLSGDELVLDEEEEEGWTQAEKAAMHSRRKVAWNPATEIKYNMYISALQWWCKHDPATGKKRAKPKDAELSGSGAAADAARFLEWYIKDGHKGYKGNMVGTKFSSKSTFKQCHAALQAHYKIGRSAAQMRGSAGSASMVEELKKDQGYQQIYKECGRLYVIERGVANPAGKDPHDNTEQATFDVDELVRMAEECVTSSDPLVARDWSMHISMCLMCGRGDDARYRLLCELTEPKYRSCIGPCPAFVVGVVQLVGKTISSNSVVHGALRNKDPLLCSQGALGRWFFTRFTYNQEPVPDFSTPDWLSCLIWPSQLGCGLTYAGHANRVKTLYKAAGVAKDKVTHGPRVFAARWADAMGLDDASIQRMGMWNLDVSAVHYLLCGLKPEVLLAMGMWPEAAKKEMQTYWRESFLVAVPQELITLLAPWLDELRTKVEAAKQAPASIRGFVKLVPYLAWVVVQDALDLAERYPKNPVHAMLLGNEVFRRLLSQYQLAKRMGMFECGRPETTSQALRNIQKGQQQMVQNLVALQAQQSQQQAAQLASLLSFAPMGWQQGVGGAAQQQQQQQQQLPSTDSHQEELDAVTQQLAMPTSQVPPGHGSAADAGLHAAPSSSSRPAPTSSVLMVPTAAPTSDLAEAGTNSLGTPSASVRQRRGQQEPDSGGDGDMEPDDIDGSPLEAALLYTPQGGVRSRSAFAGRTQLTPSQQQPAWFYGQECVGAASQRVPSMPVAAPHHQQQQQQHLGVVPQQWQQQQQQHLGVVPHPQHHMQPPRPGAQQLVADGGGITHQPQQQQQQPAWLPGGPLQQQYQQPPGQWQAGGTPSLLQLQQQLAGCPSVTGQPPGLQVSSHALMQLMQPTISSNLQLASNLGMAPHPHMGFQDPSNSINTQVGQWQAFADFLTNAVMARVQQQGVLPLPSAGATDAEQQQQQQQHQVNGWPGNVHQVSSAAGAASAGIRQVRQLSTFSSFGDLLDWYDKPLLESGQSRRQLEDANDTTWRPGRNSRKRWSELKQLLECIEKRQVEETAKQRRAVTAQQAATLLDVEWQAELALERAQGAQPHSSSLSTYHRRHIRSSGGKRRGSTPSDVDEQLAGDQDNQLVTGAAEQQALVGGEQPMAAMLGPPAAARARRAPVTSPTRAADSDSDRDVSQQQVGEEDDLLLGLAMEAGGGYVLPGGGGRSTQSAAAAGRPQSTRARGASTAAATDVNIRKRSAAAAGHAALPQVPRRARTPRQQQQQAGTSTVWRQAFPDAAQQYDQEHAAAAEAAALEAHQLGSRAAAVPTGTSARQAAAQLAAATLPSVEQQQTQAGAGRIAGAVQQEAASVPRRRGRLVLPGGLPFNPAARGPAGALTIYGAVGGPNIHVQHTQQRPQQEQSDELDVDAEMRQQQLAAVGHGA